MTSVTSVTGARVRGGAGVVVCHTRDLHTKVPRCKMPLSLMPVTNAAVGSSVGPAVGPPVVNITSFDRCSSSVIGPSGGPLMPLITTNEMAMSSCNGKTVRPTGHVSVLTAAFATVAVRGHRSVRVKANATLKLCLNVEIGPSLCAVRNYVWDHGNYAH